MSDEGKIKQLLYDYTYSGIVSKDKDKFLACFSENVIGIGLGEQGFVTSIQDVKDIYESGLKTEDNLKHEIDYKRVEIQKTTENVAIICAEIQVKLIPTEPDGKIVRSQYQQTLVAVKEEDEWKVCGLHASVPVITEEDIEAFPLKLAEKTLQNLREKIGEEVYLAEEQYRKAVLSDTIAFYIINFTKDRFEQCQLQNNICIWADPGTPYEQFLMEKSLEYIVEEDLNLFVSSLSLKNIEESFLSGTNQVNCEYRMKREDESYIWLKTIIRLIKDVNTGDKKGIMYVKDIDEKKRAEKIIKEKAEYDSMTKVLNKGTMVQQMEALLQISKDTKSTFLMIDVDDFKMVNDTFGHPIGDQVLITIAGIISNIFSSSALIGRLGGDEFAVFLYVQEVNAALKEKVNQLIETVREYRLPQHPDFPFSISIGAASLRSGSFDEFYQTADNALYEVKRRGKNAAAFSESVS